MSLSDTLRSPSGEETDSRTAEVAPAEMTAPNLRLLRQALDLTRALDETLFCAAEEGNSSVGAHLRHVIDCYHCFLVGLGAGRIDYDGRQRDSRLECERAATEEALAELIAGFERLPRELDRPLEIKVDAAAWGPGALHWQRSTLGRELQFLVSHTVHHFALIALLLRQRGYEPGMDFGVAPSTLEHRGEPVSTCAR